MAWVKHDFQCTECELEFEEFYMRSQRDDVECPECGCKELKQLISAPNIAAFSLKDAEGRRQSLMKRSREHTQKELDKEPERFGQHGIERRTKKIMG